MCAPKMPAPPDPFQTAQAQTQTNIDTAIANNRMGMVDQVTPYGSLTYETIGGPQGGGSAGSAPQTFRPGSSFNGGTVIRQDGNRVLTNNNGVIDWQTAGRQPSLTGGLSTGMNVPRYRATTTLSAPEQRVYDASAGARGNLAELANERSGFLRDYLPNATPESIDAKLYELGSQRLDPRFAREEEALRSRLANQGLTQGSAAWDAEMERFGQGRNDAYNQLVLSGRGQALAEINNPINQIAALLGMGQVQNPQVQMQQPQGMPTVNTAGLINDNWQQRAQVAQSKPNLLGGLFGLANTAINPMSTIGRMFPGAPA
jgi:hypothetical protein